ncbi:hypothetical protein EZS27_000347 [termite gut metagenome]|uniref:Nucleoside 2-deoxyribosyltransferase n=1 Tax=termite gut metagenome TaxID=433724 RepID=A0A5J4T249_9ZZZZ
MKIYVASSWENYNAHLNTVDFLRKEGHEVYNFRNPRPGVRGFSWEEIDPEYERWSMGKMKEKLNHPIAQTGFDLNFQAMQEADVCVLVLPAGASSHSEAGWMKGAGKRVYVYQIWGSKPELMYKLFDGIASSGNELRKLLKNI